MEGNTYRTIVFERFNNEAPDLASKLTGANISNELNDDIVKELTVHSFKEFLEKFSPDIYEVPVSETEIIYTLEKPVGRDIEPMKITDHSYYRMLEQCYEQKGTSGQSNLHFDDKAILEMLMPEAEIQEARRLRKLIREDLRKIEQAEKTGESSAAYEERLQDSLDRVNRTIRGSIIGMLPLAIDDSERKIQQLDKQLAAADASPDGTVPLLSGGTMEFGDDGRIVFKQIEASTTVETKEEEAPGMTVAGLIEADYESETDGQGKEFIKDLLVSVYAPSVAKASTNALASVEDIQASKDEETQKLLSYQSVYKNARASFIEQMSSIVGKLLGIKVLFDHATVKGGLNGTLMDGILISNSTIAELVHKDVRDGFKRYMEWMGKDQVAKEKIWFAVIPNVQDQWSAQSADDAASAKRKFKVGDYVRRGAQQSAPKKPQKNDGLTFGDLRSAIAILGDAKIMTFFNFQGNEKNGFGTITADYIAEHKEWFRDMKGAGHASYVYPNFTVVRERTIPLATPEQQQRFRAIGVVDDGMKLKVPAVYIDAAYPAAGIMIASQQPDYLRAKGLSVDPTLPCVRVNPADDRVKPYLMTKFNRENPLQWSEEIHRAIEQDGFGFVFSSDSLRIDGKKLENTYVLCANTLAKDKHEHYIPIEHKMIEDYVWCLYNDSNKKASGLQSLVPSLSRAWKTAAHHQENVNLMLRNDDENIAFEMEEGASPKIHIKLGNADVYVDNLKVDID